MSERQIGLAMIGCGQIAQAHLRAAAATPGVQVVATMDVIAERAAAAAQAYGGTPYTSLEAVLNNPAVEAVLLALPHHLHAPITIQAARAGKHVLVEKPMALDLAEARQMVAAAESAGIWLMVGQSTRFQPAVWATKQLIREGRLGRVRQCIYRRVWFLERLSTDWRYVPEQCGGLYLPIFASHDVDMMLWLMEDLPKRVYAVLRSHTTVTDAESDGMICLELAGGGIASLAFSLTSRIRQQSALLIGTEATALIEAGKLTVNDEPIPLDETDSFTRQMAEFVAAIRERRPPSPSGRDALPTMAVLDAARRSAETGTSVALEI